VSTSCLIGYIENDKVRYTYCHYDGYIAWTGRLLHQWLVSHEQVVDLVDGGDISAISDRTGGDGCAVTRLGGFDEPVECDLNDFVLSERKTFDHLYLWDGTTWWVRSVDLPAVMKLEDAIKWREEAQ